MLALGLSGGRGISIGPLRYPPSNETWQVSVRFPPQMRCHGRSKSYPIADTTRLRQKGCMDKGRNRAARTSWRTFAGLALVGLLIAFLIFVIFGIGECLPRDGGTHMQVCDAAKRRFFWLFPSAVVSIVIASALLHALGFRWARVVALASGFLGIAAVAISRSLFG